MISDDALTGFGLRADGLGAIFGRLWGFKNLGGVKVGHIFNSYVDSTQELVLTKWGKMRIILQRLFKLL